jgi:hypothetical protein
MISQESFARAFRQMSSLDWSAIPAVITKYDEDLQKATVKLLIKQVMRDMSTAEYPLIGGVPVVMPRTAFAGIQMPVAIGDKVLLIFTQKSIENVLYTDLSGTSIPQTVDPRSTRLKDYNDCVALVGFSDYVGAHGTSTSLTIKNNIGKEAENKIELTADGTVNVKSLKVVVEAEEVEVNATKASFTCPVEAPNFLTPTVDLNLHKHTSSAPGNPSSIPIPV